MPGWMFRWMKGEEGTEQNGNDRWRNGQLEGQTDGWMNDLWPVTSAHFELIYRSESKNLKI